MLKKHISSTNWSSCQILSMKNSFGKSADTNLNIKKMIDKLHK
jgi:hypothetical protein